MLDTKLTIRELINTLPQVGTVEWIGLRPGRRRDMVVVNEAMVSVAGGLEGDHYCGRSGKRGVTLIQAEHIEGLASMLQRGDVDPAVLRRNIVVRGVNLMALKHRVFRVGAAELSMTAVCHPCSRMEQALGPGGYNAMRGHGGITARVIRGGLIRTGDRVEGLPAADQ